MSDSTALRSIGSAFAYCLIAYQSASKGIAKLDADRDRIAADLDDAWEVLAEAVQTVMRSAGGEEPYEQLKRLTRGERLSASAYQALLQELDLSAGARQKLRTLTPATYVGMAARLAGEVLLPSDRAFDVAEVSWRTHAEALMEVRRAVFIVEQGVPEEEELDDQDETSQHFLATDANGQPIGTARLVPTGQIGRMAVVPAWRRRDVGAALLDRAVAAAKEAGLEAFLHAQVYAVGFYERKGFAASGDVFLEADIEHLKMTLRDDG